MQSVGVVNYLCFRWAYKGVSVINSMPGQKNKSVDVIGAPILGSAEKGHPDFF